MAVSFLLNFLRIGREGFGDKYYAAAVKSMLASWHNFFFASFDPGGFATVDKPAAGFWLQTLSAAVFGFKGWAVILPQAFAGALSAGLLYVLVKKTYGRTAGLIAGFVLAVTPITVAASRTNQLDILLVAVLLAAAWAITPLIHGGVPTMPFAGPELTNRNANGAGTNAFPPMMKPGAMNEGFRTEKLVEFLRKNRKNEKFLVAVPTAREAWDIILETGAPVMAIGGFLGPDKILTPEKVDRMVGAGEVRYFLVRDFSDSPVGFRPLVWAAWNLRWLGINIPVPPRVVTGLGQAIGAAMGRRGGGEAQLEVERWIEKNGTPVQDEAWRDDAGSVRVKPPAMGQFRPGNPGGRLLQAARRNALKLYDLRPEPKVGPAK